MTNNKIPFNIYFGTIGKRIGCRYKFTREYWSEELAKKNAKECATSFFYKNEGKYGIPTFSQVNAESKLTGVDIDTLYEEHINDIMRWYAIPTEEDTISSSQLKW